jgi:nickel transport protein
MFRAISLAMLALFLTATGASAHKVILSVYPGGGVIEGELGFSSGDMAADHLIEVFDEKGNKLGETMTDSEGFFTYKPVQRLTHVFRAELGSGHVGEAVVTAAELPALTEGAAPDAGSDEAAPQSSQTIPVQESKPAVQATGMDEAAVARMLRDELRPLRREIAAYKEKNDLQTILGGIGYIFGLFGLAMYIAARRRLKAGAA